MSDLKAEKDRLIGKYGRKNEHFSAGVLGGFALGFGKGFLNL